VTALRQGHNAVAYRSRGCRCQTCRRAFAIYQRRASQERAERLKAHPWLAEHGNASTYTNWGCHCEPCTAAHSARIRRWRRTGSGAR
jgi:beta-galactosidase GanA